VPKKKKHDPYADQRTVCMSGSVYYDRLYDWFWKGGRRGRGILHKKELHRLVEKDLGRYFQEGDLAPIRIGFGVEYPKWKNQLAAALLEARRAGDIVGVKGGYYHHTDMTYTPDPKPAKKVYEKITRTQTLHLYVRKPRRPK
jgi:hypothetical protein